MKKVVSVVLVFCLCFLTGFSSIANNELELKEPSNTEREIFDWNKAPTDKYSFYKYLDSVDVQYNYYGETPVGIFAPPISEEAFQQHYVAPELDLSSLTLPSSVDNSASIYFPDHSCVQTNYGNCIAFSTVYYQYTYEVNRALDIASSQRSSYSPNMPYIFAREDYDSTYLYLMSHGCLQLDVDPYITDGANINSYVIPSNSADLINALKIRASDYCIGEITGGISGPNDSDLNQIKQKLSAGYVLRVDGNFDYDYVNLSGSNTSPEMLFYRCRYDSENGMFAHSFVVVGYNDNVEYDVNGDNEIQDAERGAFKIVNSWDMSAMLGLPNSTVVYEAWILYDALNQYSSIPGSWQSTLIGQRLCAFCSNCELYPLNPTHVHSNCFAWIPSILQDDEIYYISQISYNSYSIMNDEPLLFKKTGGATLYASTSFPLNYANNLVVYQDYNMSKLAQSTSPPITVALPGDLSGSKWGFSNNDYLPLQGKVVDDLGVTIKQMSLSGSEYGANIDLPMGDVDYSGVMTQTDVQWVSMYLVNSRSFSSLQKYLADYNGDGKINAKDVIRMMSDLQGN